MRALGSRNSAPSSGSSNRATSEKTCCQRTVQKPSSDRAFQIVRRLPLPFQMAVTSFPSLCPALGRGCRDKVNYLRIAIPSVSMLLGLPKSEVYTPSATRSLDVGLGPKVISLRIFFSQLLSAQRAPAPNI